MKAKKETLSKATQVKAAQTKSASTPKKAVYQVPTENHVDTSWKRYLLPSIHPQGWPILGGMLVIFCLMGLLTDEWSWIIGLPALVFSYYFFRNPTRETPQNPNLIIAPADGLVSNIKYVVPPKELSLGKEPLLRISIFMSVFSVHVNRAPVSGTVDALFYRPGNKKRIGFVQIAGLIARRIYCPLQIGDQLKAGQIFGMIRFGSRLDVFLPKGVEPKVLLGQVCVAGETVLADMSE